MVAIRMRVPLIRAGVQINGQTNFAEALAQVFEDQLITDDPSGSSALAGRLMNVLTASADSFAPGMSHFSGIFADWTDGVGTGRRGDTGFKPCFQDFPLWPGSSMQVGHFMTAVDMGFQPSKLYNFVAAALLSYGLEGPPVLNPDTPIRPSWWTFGELECVQLIIAHEQIPDSGVYGQEPDFWNKVSTILANVTQTDSDNFWRAFVGLGAGPQHDTDKAAANLAGINIGNGSGNSRQDLLLSLFGFKFGTMIRKGELTNIADGGNWIRVNLVDASFQYLFSAPGTAGVAV
jgi:hypothetical protein